MAAGARYRKARFALAAVVAAGVIGGTAYFAGAAQPPSADAGNSDTAAVTNVAGAAPARPRAVVPAPAKRSKGS